MLIINSSLNNVIVEILFEFTIEPIIYVDAN